MTSKIIHFDTINGDDQTDEAYSTRTGTTGQSLNINSQNYFTRIPLVNALYNVSNIELSSVEFLNSIYNVRAENGSNTLTFKFTYQGVQNTISVFLSPKNYTAIAELLVDINSSILVQISQKPSLAGFSIVISVNQNDSGKVIIKSLCDSISITDSILARYILGIVFNKAVGFNDLHIYNALTGFSTLTATNNYNLQCDNYININFTNILHSGAANADAKICTYKLPLYCAYNEVVYYTSGNNFPQVLSLESNRTVTHLMLKVTDRWGFPVYSASGFSFSLTFYF